MAKDTTVIYDVKPYGIGYDSSFKFVTKGKTVLEGKQLWGYDKNSGKYILAEMIKGMDNLLYVFWFTSKNKGVVCQYSDVSNFDAAKITWEFEFKSADSYSTTTYVNQKAVKTDTWTRIN